MDHSVLKAQPVVDDFVAPSCNEYVKILYQDDDILLVSKPSGLLSLSGKNPLNWDSLHYRLVHGQAGMTPPFVGAKLAHRLDFGTSGIALVALNAHSAKHLNKQFQQRTIVKRYSAILEGWLKDDEGLINAPISKDKEHFPLVKICAITGKAALTEYKVIKRLDQPKRSVVQFIPHTGRTHQLRIHSQLLGHPILGCDLYNSKHSAQLAERLLLHASDLSFQHPISGEQFHAQCMSDF
ncbi:RluA family pseudouridine synthase [Pseudoalteromonas mariniglutinosa]|uniref:RluA family pseudouridine synthase n=1 Tax=Pseudoalteromonas mariniglutinosa TaxID=206042 RepID=UPI0038509103